MNGKTALVTGGARDIGAAIVGRLVEAGAKVVVNYFGSEDRANEVVRGSRGQAIAVRADVTKQSDIDNLVKKTAEFGGGKFDILINNAGGLLARKKLDEMDEKFIDDVLAINFKSMLLVTRASLPFMNDGGTIVNSASLAAHDGGGPGSIVYAASKGAVLTATRGLAKELAGRKIRVNAVSPGLINTTFHDTFTKPEARQATAARTTLGREGESDDVAKVVRFLASDESSYINGECIEINGGLYFV